MRSAISSQALLNLLNWDLLCYWSDGLLHAPLTYDLLLAIWLNFTRILVSQPYSNQHTTMLKTSVGRMFPARPHLGRELFIFPAGDSQLNDIRKLLSAMLTKLSTLDVMPYSMMKSCADAPLYLCRLEDSLCTTLAAGTEKDWTRQFIFKLHADIHLLTVSKVLERLVLTHLHPHLLNSYSFSQFQSAYSKGHSIETALLEVLDGIYTAADDKQVTVIVGLSLSATFDTVSHVTLLECLQTRDLYMYGDRGKNPRESHRNGS